MRVAACSTFGPIAWVMAMVLAVVGSACREGAPSRTDTKAERVVSIGGAVTETVFALGAGEAVVAVDSSSIFPDEAKRLPRVGYQRTLSLEGVLALNPTVLVAGNEAGPPSVLERLREVGVRVVIVSSVPSADGARERITDVARALGRDPKHTLDALDADLRASRADHEASHDAGASSPRALVVYARGAGALHVFGEHSAGDSMLVLAGAVNAIHGFDGTKPLDAEALTQAAPEVLVIPTRGLESLGGLDELLRMPGVAETPAGKNRNVVVMDDTLLLGFGPRTGKAVLELGRALRGNQK